MVNRVIKTLLNRFEHVADGRADNKQLPLPALLAQSFAMFHLKDPSMLQFRRQHEVRADNLRRVYGVDKLPTDTSVRQAVDQVEPSELQAGFDDLAALLDEEQVWQQRRVLNARFTAVSVDATQYYCTCNAKRSCPHCIVKKHRNGKTSYAHQLLGAVNVRPDSAVVLPVGGEAIVKQDGCQKNDCELNAAKRLLPQVRRTLGEAEELLFVFDALYHNGPLIELVHSPVVRGHYIIGAKGDNYVRIQADRLAEQGKLKTLRWHDAKFTYTATYTNGLILNGANQDIKVNYFKIVQTKLHDEQSVVLVCDWITDLPIEVHNVRALVALGRSRWKIENETFNTLKNQGYNLKHNYGHGQRYLSTNFALLMLLAFLTDQIALCVDELFQKAKQVCGSFKLLWQRIREVFDLAPVKSIEAIYRFITQRKLLDIPLLE